MLTFRYVGNIIFDSSIQWKMIFNCTLHLYMSLMGKWLERLWCHKQPKHFPDEMGFCEAAWNGKPCLLWSSPLARDTDVTLTRTRSGRQTPASRCWQEKPHRAAGRYNTEQWARARLPPGHYFLQQSLGWLFEPPVFVHMLLK